VVTAVAEMLPEKLGHVLKSTEETATREHRQGTQISRHILSFCGALDGNVPRVMPQIAILRGELNRFK
jgi:hypothetical protein